MSKIIEKIKKLLNLAKDKCNKHEAERAAQKAQQLITEYNINEAMFTVNPREEPWWVGFLLKVSSAKVWELTLAAELSQANYGAAALFRDGIKFCGAERDYENTKWLFQWICKQMEELAVGEGITALKSRTDYKQGIVETLGNRLKWAKEDAERQARCDALLAELEGKFALVTVDVATQELNEYLAKVRELVSRNSSAWGAQSGISDADAYNAGVRDGHKINFNAGSLE